VVVESLGISAGVADRFGCKQRLLQRCAGTDVRPRRAGAHRDADARLGQIDAAAGNDLALPDQLLQFGARDDDEVVALAGGHALHDRRRARPGGRDPVSGGALELRHQLEIGLLGGDRRQDFDFSHDWRAVLSGAMVQLSHHPIAPTKLRVGPALTLRWTRAI